MKNQSTKKLCLHKETLARLDNQALGKYYAGKGYENEQQLSPVIIIGTIIITTLIPNPAN